MSTLLKAPVEPRSTHNEIVEQIEKTLETNNSVMSLVNEMLH